MKQVMLKKVEKDGTESAYLVDFSIEDGLKLLEQKDLNNLVCYYNDEKLYYVEAEDLDGTSIIFYETEIKTEDDAYVSK